MLTRKIGKILRGSATPFQLMAAAILGSLLAGIQGITHAPGLALTLTLTLIVLNANLTIAVLVAILAKVVLAATLPISFALGAALVDGPLEPLIRYLINAPGTAFFGFEYYTTTGALLITGLFGTGTGFALVKIVAVFRRTMARLDEGSDRFRELNNRKSVKLAKFILLGSSKVKKEYSELLENNATGNPIRPLGLVFVAVVIAFIIFASMFADDVIIRAAIQAGLERANGATVDLEQADLDLKAGRLTLSRNRSCRPGSTRS